MQQRIPVLVLAICAALALIVSAWPRFVGGAVTAPYEDSLREIARGETLGPADLAEAVTALSVARGWVDLPQNRFLTGGLKLVEARQARDPLVQREKLDAAIEDLSEGLRRRPAQPYVWLQLGQSVRARQGAIPAIERYLTASLTLAPWEHRLVMPRLDLALAVWTRLSPDFQQRLPGQFERAVDTAPIALARAVRRNFALRAARQMLAGSPVHLDRFRIVYLSPD